MIGFTAPIFYVTQILDGCLLLLQAVFLKVIRILKKIRKIQLGAIIAIKLIKSYSDDYDSGSIDSLTSDSRANGKFTDFEHLRKITLKKVNLVTISQININLLRN